MTSRGTKELVIYHVDPIKLTIHQKTDNWEAITQPLLDLIKDRYNALSKDSQDDTFVSRLKRLNDAITDVVVRRVATRQLEWDLTPADTRFPGFFTTLTDHALSVSSVAVALGLELHERGVDFSSDDEVAKVPTIRDVVKQREGLRMVLRVCGFFHDVGKPSFEKHVERGIEKLPKFYKDLGFTDEEASFLTNTSCRHHYGKYYRRGKPELLPQTKLEWVIAHADKVAVQDRSTKVNDLDKFEYKEALEWLQEPLNRQLGLKEDSKKNIEATIKFMEALKKTEASSIPSSVEGVDDDVLCMLFPISFEKTHDSLEAELSSNIKRRYGVEDVALSLLIVEVGGIQKYITRSMTKKYLKGSSAMLEAVSEAIAQLIEKQLAPENVLIRTSGSVVALVPSTLQDSLKQSIKKEFEQRISGIHSIKLSSTNGYTLFELKHGPIKLWKSFPQLRRAFERRHFGYLVSHEMMNLQVTPLANIASSLQSPPQPKNWSDVCSDCYKDHATREWEDVEGVRMVCESCYEVLSFQDKIEKKEPVMKVKFDNSNRLIIEVDKSRLNDEMMSLSMVKVLLALERIVQDPKHEEVIKSFIEKHQSTFKAFKGKTFVFKGIKTWNELGYHSQKGFLKVEEGIDVRYPQSTAEMALIRGDGDNFGKIKQEMTSITLYRNITRILEEIIIYPLCWGLLHVLLTMFITASSDEVKKDVASSQNKTMEATLPWQIVYVGGDDFTLMLDAAYTLAFINGFNEMLTNLLGHATSKYEKGWDFSKPLSIHPIGVSMGVGIAKRKTPLFKLFDAVKELEDLAKQHSKSLNVKFGGKVTACLHRFQAVPSREEVKMWHVPFVNKPITGSISNMFQIKRKIWPKTWTEFQTDYQPHLINLCKLGLTHRDIERFITIEQHDISEELIKIRADYKIARVKGSGKRKRKGLMALNQLLFKKVNDNKTLNLVHQDLGSLIETCVPSRIQRDIEKNLPKNDDEKALDDSSPLAFQLQCLLGGLQLLK